MATARDRHAAYCFLLRRGAKNVKDEVTGLRPRHLIFYRREGETDPKETIERVLRRDCNERSSSKNRATTKKGCEKRLNSISMELSQHEHAGTHNSCYPYSEQCLQSTLAPYAHYSSLILVYMAYLSLLFSLASDLLFLPFLVLRSFRCNKCNTCVKSYTLYTPLEKKLQILT